MSDEIVGDGLDDGVIDVVPVGMSNLDSDIEPVDADEPATVPDGGEAPDGAGETPEAPSASSWLDGIDADDAKVAEVKGWKSPADALKSYRELEKLTGKRSTELAELRAELEEARAAAAAAAPAREVPAKDEKQEPEAFADPSDMIDWELFDKVSGDTFGEAFATFSKQVLPAMLEAHVKRMLEPVQQQLEPVQNERALVAEATEIANEFPDAWDTLKGRVGEVLDQWAGEGYGYEEGFVRQAWNIARDELLAEQIAAMKGGVQPEQQQQAAPPVSEGGVEAEVPAAAATPAPTADELRPLTSSTAATAPPDYAQQAREAIRMASAFAADDPL